MVQRQNTSLSGWLGYDFSCITPKIGKTIFTKDRKNDFAMGRDVRLKDLDKPPKQLTTLNRTIT